MNELSNPPDVAPPRRSLLPFFFANLLAVYLPGLLPTLMPANEQPVEFDFNALRIHAIEFLNAPYGVVSLFTDGGMMMLSTQLGELGSFYLFFFGLWLLVLGITLLGRNEKRRYWVTFFLFVLFSAQAIFMTRQAIIDGRALEGRPAVEDDGEPKLPAARPVEVP
ncbi:MAG: hypothetical protein C0483_01615 [Pirellula sp.]|nr:hypothetical protein [Pirellula sp.]